MRKKYLALLLMAFSILLTGCKDKGKTSAKHPENKEAKVLLQGIWVDDDSGEVIFKIKGDTIYYPDTTSVPAYFKIVSDTLIMGASAQRYAIEKQSPHLFWFKNQNDDLVKLRKSDDPNDVLAFEHSRPTVLTLDQVLKRDTVVMHGANRYHLYTAINPTKYKVIIPTYSDEGVEVDNVYYDNIIHISIYEGAKQLFSRDFHKSMFGRYVPQRFINTAILSDMVYEGFSNNSFRFNANICNPLGASCYMIRTTITKDGKVKMETIEY